MIAPLIALFDCGGSPGANPNTQPDGEDFPNLECLQVAYAAPDPNHIRVTNYDGSNDRQLTTGKNCGERLPQWSPDATKIAYLAEGPQCGGFESNRGTDIFVVDINKKETRNVTSSGLSEDTHFSWSPDGQWIAFSSTRGGQHEIYIIDNDGSDLRKLSQLMRGSRNLNDVHTAWIPGTNNISFLRGEDEEATSFYGSGNLYVVSRDGGNEREILSGIRVGIDIFTGNIYQWSPDGARIALSIWDWEDVSTDLYVADGDGANIINLTADVPQERNSGPSWSSNRGSIAYISGSNTSDVVDDPFSPNPITGADVYVVNASNSMSENITQGAMMSVGFVEFSPEGTLLLVMGRQSREEETNVYSIHVETKEVRRLTNDGGYFPKWSPVCPPSF